MPVRANYGKYDYLLAEQHRTEVDRQRVLGILMTKDFKCRSKGDISLLKASKVLELIASVHFNNIYIMLPTYVKIPWNLHLNLVPSPKSGYQQYGTNSTISSKNYLSDLKN